MSRRYATLDVFTSTVLTGNPLAVVFDADDLDDAQMLAIAREFNLSETVFVCSPTNPVHSARVRIFTPGGELPFAGHPTVGTAVLLAMDRMGDKVDVETDLLIVLEEKIGLVRVAVVLRPDQPGYAIFDVPRTSEPTGGTLDRDLMADALGLSRHDIGFESHMASRYSSGVPFTLVPVSGMAALSRIKINLAAWEEAFGFDGHSAAFVYCRETEFHSSQFRARMFAPGAGISEDPATGSAIAAFAGAIAQFDRPRDGLHHFTIEQGFEMSRPSLIKLEIDMANGKLDASRIGGQAVKITEGVISI